MSVTRRTFVGTSLGVIGCASLGSSGCGNDVSPAPVANVTVDDDSTSQTYGMISIIPAMYPQLAELGGAITLKIAALAAGTRPFSVPEKGILLLHRDPTDGSAEYVAVRSDCPHQGCPLGYSYKDDLVECPCHGSRFLASGDASNAGACAGLVVHPPAKDNLTVWKVTDDGSGTIFVDLNTIETCGTSNALPPVSGGVISFPITMIPALGMVGGSIIGAPTGLGDTIIVARVDENTVVAVSDICTHQGCSVALDEADMRFNCPCHGSEFKLDGSVISGPATVALKRYTTTFDGTTVTITAS